VIIPSDFASPVSVATRSLWISIVFKPSKLRYIKTDCWPSEITNLNGSVLTSEDVKTDDVLVVC
jgi:hypothetical protein